MRRRLLAVMGSLVVGGGLVGGLRAYRARNERIAAELAAEERIRAREREKAELEAKLAAIEREMAADRRRHPPERFHDEERQRIREEARRQAEWATRHRQRR